MTIIIIILVIVITIMGFVAIAEAGINPSQRLLCMSCGTENPSIANFCRRCGRKLIEECE